VSGSHLEIADSARYSGTFGARDDRATADYSSHCKSLHI